MRFSVLRWCSLVSSLLLYHWDLVNTQTECSYGLKELWSSNLRNSPLMATPLLFDVDGDGFKDIVATSFSGEVWAIHGENGHIVDNWPFYLEERAFYASPLVYDINGDGLVEFLLTTTDAEILFVQADNTLLHGETIKIPPLKMKRQWYRMDRDYLQNLANQLSQQIANPDQFSVNREYGPSQFAPRRSPNFTSPYSDYDSRYGRYSDPLYSRHQPEIRVSGVDPQDSEFVYIDPHVLATPTIADTNNDGVANELVVPVSYYFDPFFYADGRNLDKLGGLDQEELVHFTAGGIVIVDLNTGFVVGHKMIGLAQASSSQPGYLLTTPTVVKLHPYEKDAVVLIGSVTGELHALGTTNLQERGGFPIMLDSITSQVAVADLLSNGALQMVVGDNSGNLYCIDHTGKRLWERELDVPVIASPRFADLEGDGNLEVVVSTQTGDVWILDGQTGVPHPPSYPLHLQVGSQASVMLAHLDSTRKDGKVHKNALSLVLPVVNGLHIIDALTGCIDTLSSDHVLLEVLFDDVDPYNPGLELLAISLDGHLVCFSTQTDHSSEIDVALESWPGDTIGQNGFTHKSSAFAIVLPGVNETVKEVTGGKFRLNFQLFDNSSKSVMKAYTVLVTVGRKYVLFNDSLQVTGKLNDFSLTVTSPPTPLHSFLTLKICNERAQCDSVTYNIKFNLHFEDNLQWYLSLPFLSLCFMVLWLYRDAGGESLPTTTTGTLSSTSTRKDI